MDDGKENILIIDEDRTLHLIEPSGNDRVERWLGIPYGMTLPKEFAAGTWEELRLLYYDEMASGVAVAMPSLNSAPAMDRWTGPQGAD
jgi:hypothetical protein